MFLNKKFKSLCDRLTITVKNLKDNNMISILIREKRKQK